MKLSVHRFSTLTLFPLFLRSLPLTLLAGLFWFHSRWFKDGAIFSPGKAEAQRPVDIFFF